MSFRRRTFPEVLDNLLTTVTEGVASEVHPFPPPNADAPPYSHSIQEAPATDVVSIYGTRFGSSNLFRKDTDYALSGDGLSIEWLEGAQLPDNGSTINVNYRPESAQPSLTDIHTGSVVRTLAETVALEIARLYAQMDAVYQSAYVDTATATSLENVVALLGIERVEGGHATGEVEFRRSAATPGAIAINAGTRVMTSDGSVEYETTGAATLAPGQDVARVTVRDIEVNDPLEADTLTVLPIPIAGVESVTNPAPTTIDTQSETDAELRTRAKAFLHGSERATVGAITNAIKKQGLTADVDEVDSTPGYVEITPHAEGVAPDTRQRLLAAIEDTRPAGVIVDLQDAEAPKKVNLELRLTTVTGLLEQDLRAAQRSVRDNIEDYFARLPAREVGSVNRIVGHVLNVPEVEDVRILRATWDGTPTDVLDRDNGLLTIDGHPTVLDEIQMADPALPTQVNAVVTYPNTESPPDVVSIRSDVSAALAYLNDLNASELSADPLHAAKRIISFGKLLRVVSLPGKAGETLASHDQAVAVGTPPVLPTELSIAPYEVLFTITIESGLSRILSEASDLYTLTPFERLTLSGVEVTEEPPDA